MLVVRWRRTRRSRRSGSRRPGRTGQNVPPARDRVGPPRGGRPGGGIAQYGLAPTTVGGAARAAAAERGADREQWAIASQIIENSSARDLALRHGTALADMAECLGSLTRAGVCSPVRLREPRQLTPGRARPVRTAGPASVGSAAPMPPRRTRRRLRHRAGVAATRPEPTAAAWAAGGPRPTSRLADLPPPGPGRACASSASAPGRVRPAWGARRHRAFLADTAGRQRRRRRRPAVPTARLIALPTGPRVAGG